MFGDPTMDENAHDQRGATDFSFATSSTVILLRKAEALPSVGGAAGVFLYGPRGHANVVLRYAATERAVRNSALLSNIPQTNGQGSGESVDFAKAAIPRQRPRRGRRQRIGMA